MSITTVRYGREIFSGAGRKLVDSKDPYIHEFIQGTELLPSEAKQGAVSSSNEGIYRKR
jgi:hypothetical protein